MSINNLLEADYPDHIILIFIDGIGIGQFDRMINPFARNKHQLFSAFSTQNFPQETYRDGIILGLDTTLEVDGLPQSATGQTSLLTGVNAASLLGRHLSRFPNEELRSVIKKSSILKQIVKRDLAAAFLNTFRPRFFQTNAEHLVSKLSVTTLANLYANLSFFSFDDLAQRQSIYHDLTNQSLIEKGFNVPVFTPEEAGEILVRRSRDFFFLLFEYFQTDRAGHGQDFSFALNEIVKLERFLLSVLKQINLSDTLLIITSDHGNLEDLSTKSHTFNQVFTLLFGKGSHQLKCSLKSICDVSPGILSFAGKRE